MKTYEMKNGLIKIIKISASFQEKELEELKKLFAGEGIYSELIIDLADADYLDRSLLDLLAGYKALKPHLDGKIKLVNPNALVLKMLESRDLDQLYEIQHIYPTVW